MKIYIANDHSAIWTKNKIKEYLEQRYEVIDLGTNNTNSCNYVDYANKACLCVDKDPEALGILICGTGVGISIAANRNKNIRCAILYNDEVARLAKEHNNANIIAFGARQMEIEDIIKRIDIFLNASFEGGRHQVRIESLD